MSNPIEELAQLKEAYEVAVKERGQDVVDYIFKDFFDKNPNIHGVVWTQYTPYFMDGDPCVFTIHEPVFLIDKSEPVVADLDPEDYDEVGDEDYDEVGDEEYGAYSSDEEYGAYSSYDFYNWGAGVGKTFDTPEKEAVYNVINQVESALNTVEDVLESIFGDHAQVTVTRTGYEVDEYSHD